MRSSAKHIQRVKDNLRAVGVTKYGLIKFSSRYLPKVIHPDEQIKGVVYGRYGEGSNPGFEGMLVATDRRIIFLDHKPGYTSMEELTYDAVSGVETSTAGFFTSITLHTKLGDFVINYANKKCVAIFVNYIEIRRLETRVN